MSLIDTAICGNTNAGRNHVDSKNPTSYAAKIEIYSDGDKIRGIRLEYKDGKSQNAGDCGYQNKVTFDFEDDETLMTMVLRDSGYGHGSLRQLEFTTSKDRSFSAGPGGFNHEVSLAVEKRRLAGYFAWVNQDNFISAIRFRVLDFAPEPKPQPVRWFQTAIAGNPDASKSIASLASETACARYFAVRSDGDKIRGIRLELTDGTAAEAGNFADDSQTLKTYTFQKGETLKSLVLGASGWGHGSLRQLTFTTSRPGHFSAGPGGTDYEVTAPAKGARICGFHAWVNQDKFINAFAFRLTDDVPFQVNFTNFSPWQVSYVDGTLTVNGKPAITFTSDGYDTHGVSTSYTRTVKVTNGDSVSYCLYSGGATLDISVFGDETFEANFGQFGTGTAKGVIRGLNMHPTYATDVEGLVRKYAPAMMLNEDEVYWPTTIDAFLSHMILQKVNHGITTDFYTGQLDRDVLAKQAQLLGQNNNSEGACLRTRADLNHPSDTQDWFNGVKPDSNGVTSYAVVVNGKNEKLDITYWWFFNYNQGKTVASTSWGNHVSDWEHVKISLEKVNFVDPGREVIAQISYDAHGDKTIIASELADFIGSQVAVHLANGDHEAYPHVGVYDRPMGTHDYCKANPCVFDQRLGPIEIYEWDAVNPNGGFKPPPPGASSNWKDPAWLGYRGRWGNWERGSAFGAVAILEKGPEGMWRAGEYAKP